MEEEKGEQSIFLYLLIYGVLGGILGGIIFYFLKPNFIYILIGFLLGIILGLIFFGISKLPQENRKTALTIFFLILIIIFLLIFINKFFSFFSFNLKGIGSFFSSSFSWFSCIAGRPECPAFEHEKEEIKAPDFLLSLEYSRDYIKDNNIDMFVKITLTNKKIENLTMFPYCYKDGLNKESLRVYGLQDYKEDDHFVFPISDRIITGFWCKGRTTFQKENVYVGLEIPYSTKIYWTIYASENKKEKKQAILEKKELPYLIVFDTPFDMPLKNGKYNFFIKMKENPDYGFSLREIENIDFYSSPDTTVFCEPQLKKIEEEELKDYYDEKKKEYVFPCQLIISNAPFDVVEPRYININISYKVYKEFEHVIREKY